MVNVEVFVSTPTAAEEREAIAKYLDTVANLHMEAAETEGDPTHARIGRRIRALARAIREKADKQE
jgi:hypothetical protein